MREQKQRENNSWTPILALSQAEKVLISQRTSFQFQRDDRGFRTSGVISSRQPPGQFLGLGSYSDIRIRG